MSGGLIDTQNLNLSEKSDPVIFTVEQLNSEIRSLIESHLSIVWIRAEISNFKPHTSGHFYFSLKDSKSQISAVMFRGNNAKLKFKPHDGLEVIVRGKISVYEPRGSYQIVCDSMEPVGAGALQKQFEQLKEKLRSEGLFDQTRKKTIPHYPKSIAIVTSPTGAAIQDILNILNRRAKSIEVTIVPTLVQGAAAAPQIVEAYKKAMRLNPDVIIIGRGGGSIEDMWCFNDENLARTIAASSIPTISAVGHEIDFTICDFVSDLRAPTPSAAAELVAKSSVEVIQKIIQTDRLIKNAFKKIFQLKFQKLVFLSKQLVDPKKKLETLSQRNDELLLRLEQGILNIISNQKKDILLLERSLVNPIQIVQKYILKLSNGKLNLDKAMKSTLLRADLKLKNIMGILDSLSPLKVVDRGYSIVTSESKQLIKSTKSIKTGETLVIQLADGKIESEVKKIIMNK